MPRFVILEHCWNGIHWDFMLEDRGALRTWAIDEPLEHGRNLQARALGDHRLAYLDYEGPVSQNRGAVRRLARGTYHAEIWTAEWIVVRLDGDQFLAVADLRKSETGGSAEGRGGWTVRLGKVD